MPINVTRFETLAYISIGIGVIVAALEYRRLSTIVNPAAVLLIQFLVLLLIVWLIWLTARRRKNWARWLFLIFFLLGVPFYIPNLSDMMTVNPLAGFLSAMQLFVQGAALYFVFSGDANGWVSESN